jgi:hypothetical protein
VVKETLNIGKNVTPVVDAPHISKTKKEAAKEKLAQLIEEETRLVRGIFQCFETPGSTTKITVRKYPGIPHFEQSMTDGETYEIPLYVARHLNGIDVSAGALGDPNKRNSNIGTCSYPVHGFMWKSGSPPPNSALGDGGVPVPMIGVAKRVKRFGFQSMEFAGSIT